MHREVLSHSISYFLRRFASYPSLACACDTFPSLMRSHHKKKERVVKSNSLFHPQFFERVLRPYALPLARKHPTSSFLPPPSPFSSPIILFPRAHRSSPTASSNIDSFSHVTLCPPFYIEISIQPSLSAFCNPQSPESSPLCHTLKRLKQRPPHLTRSICSPS